MDRFIVSEPFWLKSSSASLKSNMDRFIADKTVNNKTTVKNFKIQYG